MISAVFDLDRTLLPETTAERLFLWHLARNRIIGRGALVRTVNYIVRTGFGGAIQRVRADRPYLVGLHEARLWLEGRRVVHQTILPRLSHQGIERVKQHRDAGHCTVLLSGSLPYVVEPLAARLGFDHVICSRPRVDRHRLTGGLVGLHPYGEAKATLIRELSERCGLDLSASYCYADHHTDIPMLRLFGFPVCVNPSEELRRYAAKCGWQVEAYR
jgi:alcohol-forming fatty acyl-CoA reductase